MNNKNYSTIMLLLLALISAAFACNHTQMWLNGTITVSPLAGPQSCARVKCVGNTTLSCVKLRSSPCENVNGNFVFVPAEWLRELAHLSPECANAERAAVLGGFSSSAAECCLILQTHGETIAAVAIMAAFVVAACVYGVVYTYKNRD